MWDPHGPDKFWMTPSNTEPSMKKIACLMSLHKPIHLAFRGNEREVVSSHLFQNSVNYYCGMKKLNKNKRLITT